MSSRSRSNPWFRPQVTEQYACYWCDAKWATKRPMPFFPHLCDACMQSFIDSQQRFRVRRFKTLGDGFLDAVQRGDYGEQNDKATTRTA